MVTGVSGVKGLKENEKVNWNFQKGVVGWGVKAKNLPWRFSRRTHLGAKLFCICNQFFQYDLDIEMISSWLNCISFLDYTYPFQSSSIADYEIDGNVNQKHHNPHNISIQFKFSLPQDSMNCIEQTEACKKKRNSVEPVFNKQDFGNNGCSIQVGHLIQVH